jgi:outer membrane protein OmpA-like peptidoglycan-associated protein
MLGGLAAVLLISGAAHAQEMTADQIAAEIQRAVGTTADPSLQDSGSRAIIMENGVDAEREPRDIAPSPVPVASTPTNCKLISSFWSILFDRGSARLSSDPESEKTLFELATALAKPQFSGKTFLIRGHTDATGSVQTNAGLSQRRAQAVAARLAALGMPISRLSAHGMGSSMPAEADTHSYRNRRVDICV